MDERDAESMAEMPEPRRKVAAGSREGTVEVRQTSAAGKEEPSSKTTTLMEQVVERANLKRALRRVVSTRGRRDPTG